MTTLPARTLLSALTLAALASCGGGGGGSDTTAPGGNPGGGNPGGGNPGGGSQAPMTMSCVDGANFQCSGAAILRTDNGVALSDSGVQVHAISTSDLAANNTSPTGAFGFRPVTSGVTEVRVAKNASGASEAIYLLLRNLGLRWDAVNERPPIVEVFNPTQGRVVLNGSGAVNFLPLPDSTDLAFYDYATRGRAATQANYANNRYFPRANNPSRCPPDLNPCPSTETSGLSYGAGNWRGAGLVPDVTEAGRLHADGDIHAGDGPRDANGNRTWLEGGSGFGIPYPSSKGYRSITNWGYQYANMATWTTQDTVDIAEWSTGGLEHNKNRRGAIAFGPVTAPQQVPSTGTATYTGIAYGWYAASENVAEPTVFWANATATANFASGTVVVTFTNARSFDAQEQPLPVNLSASMTRSIVAAEGANYATGAGSTGGMNGGVSVRYFGPTSAGAPPEIGGAFTLSNAGTTQSAIGGFIGRRQ